MSHAELDEAPELDEGDPADLAARIGRLRAHLPNLRVVGGCCGTDSRHVAALWGSRRGRPDYRALDRRPQGAARLPGVDLLRTKSVEQSMKDTEDPEFKLKRSLTALDLTVFGVGVIIGAGIFTLTGRVAQANAGPAVSLSFVLAAVCCALAALCYAEFASTVPVSGSAYTFSYATLGELIAWIIGWDLLLEMMLGASVVAQGWASYFETFLDQIGIGWPAGSATATTSTSPPSSWSRSSRPSSPTGSRSRCGSTWCWWPSSCSSSCS